MLNYRQIYEQLNGPIPKDADGRSFEIHHIDGDRTNNSTTNLMALTIQEHYDIHYSQEDWGACQAIIMRMNKTPMEISKTCRELAKKNAQKRVAAGTHNLQRRADGTSLTSDRVKLGTNPFQTRKDGSSLAKDRVANGSHHFLNPQFQSTIARQRVANGTHHFQNLETQRANTLKRVADGTHPSQVRVACPYCNKEGPLPQMKQWHFNNCKLKGE
jgi:hypothetical protein